MEHNQPVGKIGKAIFTEHLLYDQCPVGKVVVMEEKLTVKVHGGNTEADNKHKIGRLEIKNKKIFSSIFDKGKKTIKNTKSVQNVAYFGKHVENTSKKKRRRLKGDGDTWKETGINL